MLKQEPHSIHKGGREWRLGADEFPISTTVTGVVLDLEPGRAPRAALASQRRRVAVCDLRQDLGVTMFGSHGRYRIETLEQGDSGYIPQGYGHSLENAGDTEPARVLIGFNTGHYEAIDLSSWLAGNPKSLLANNFQVSEAVVEQFPHDRVFIAPKGGSS